MKRGYFCFETGTELMQALSVNHPRIAKHFFAIYSDPARLKKFYEEAAGYERQFMDASIYFDFEKNHIKKKASGD